MTHAEIIALQQQLNAAGAALTVDGVYGPATAQAYQAWLNANTPADMPTPAPPAAKPWWASRAILGLLATLIANLASRSGYVVEAGALTDALLQLVEVGGLVVALWGTVRRTAPLDPSLVAPGLRLAALAAPLSARRAGAKPPGPFGY